MGFINSGRFRQAEGYVAELEGQYEIIDRVGISTSEGQIGLTSVEETLPESGKVGDSGLRLFQEVQGGPIVRVIWDSKMWSQWYLDLVLNGPRFDKLVAQIQGYQLNPTKRVVLQFTETQSGRITSLAPLWQRLSDPGLALDMTRLSLRTVEMWETPLSQLFQAGVYQWR